VFGSLRVMFAEFSESDLQQLTSQLKRLYANLEQADKPALRAGRMMSGDPPRSRSHSSARLPPGCRRNRNPCH